MPPPWKKTSTGASSRCPSRGAYRRTGIVCLPRDGTWNVSIVTWSRRPVSAIKCSAVASRALFFVSRRRAAPEGSVPSCPSCAAAGFFSAKARHCSLGTPYLEKSILNGDGGNKGTCVGVVIPVIEAVG